jgi:hypothetical protein
MQEEVHILVCKAQTSATGSGTPSAVEAFLLTELGAQLRAIIETGAGRWFTFDNRDLERVTTRYEVLKQAAEQQRAENAEVSERARQISARLVGAMLARMGTTKGR